jgi:hypothetical protein
MIPIVVFAGIAVLLFAGSFISKRRFGVLGLALAAGATLSTIWGHDAGLVVAASGIVKDSIYSQAAAQALVVLLPAIVLMFHGYSYKHWPGRLIGSLLFTGLALAFLVEPIGFVLPLDGFGNTVYQTIRQYQDIIISVGIVVAVVDLLFTRTPHHDEHSRKKH